MLEGIFSFFSFLFESILAVFTGLIDFIASFFVAAGQTLTALDLFLLVFVLIAEILVWVIILLAQLLYALVKFRKPKLPKKPVFWRPRPKLKVKK